MSTSHAPGLFVCIAASAVAAPPTPSRVVIVIEENHSFNQVIGNPDAPYLNALAAAGASLTSMYAITHPSQPNYLQFFSGSNQGVTDNTVPAPGAPFTTPNLAASLLASGATFVGFSEDLPFVGFDGPNAAGGLYVRKHNPWVNWQNTPRGPNQLAPEINRPFSDFPSDFSLLPAVCIVVPNQQNDMHDGTIAQADAWLATRIEPFRQWAMANNALLVVTWDEDESASRNRIPTILVGPMIRPGAIDQCWTLHNLCRTILDMHAAAPFASVAAARPFTGPFRDDHLVATRRFSHGAGGYAGVLDTMIEQAAPDAPGSAADPLVADGSPLRQILIRFDDLFGPAPDQVPPGAAVLSAKLLLLTGPSSANGDSSDSSMSLHRLLVPFNAASTWNTLGGGVSADGVESLAAPDFTLIPNVRDAWAIFDVTATVQSWSDLPATNLGWVIRPSGTDGWRPRSSEASALADRPVLEITYDLGPACAADFNHDGSVDDFDVFDFLNAFFQNHYLADFNRDGSVDDFDFFDLFNVLYDPC
ncbi:MAG: DNRLRE domain-containing protein [Phycisphaerae bacterium]|nr:DNRLRE domain-containing protein [Phycisphaerae bacterium]